MRTKRVLKSVIALAFGGDPFKIRYLLKYLIAT